jgi:hypothetical protein
MNCGTRGGGGGGGEYDTLSSFCHGQLIVNLLIMLKI